MYSLYMPERPFWRSDDDLSRLTAHLRHTCYAICYVFQTFQHARRMTVSLLWIDRPFFFPA